jgi:hypothetical protein
MLACPLESSQCGTSRHPLPASAASRSKQVTSLASRRDSELRHNRSALWRIGTNNNGMS